MYLDDVIDGGIGCLLVCIVAALVFGLGGWALDSFVYDRRAFDAQVACRARRMDAERKVFSTHVVCIPVNARQDTTTAQVR